MGSIPDTCILCICPLGELRLRIVSSSPTAILLTSTKWFRVKVECSTHSICVFQIGSSEPNRGIRLRFTRPFPYIRQAVRGCHLLVMGESSWKSGVGPRRLRRSNYLRVPFQGRASVHSFGGGLKVIGSSPVRSFSRECSGSLSVTVGSNPTPAEREDGRVV